MDHSLVRAGLLSPKCRCCILFKGRSRRGYADPLAYLHLDLPTLLLLEMDFLTSNNCYYLGPCEFYVHSISLWRPTKSQSVCLTRTLVIYLHIKVWEILINMTETSFLAWILCVCSFTTSFGLPLGQLSLSLTTLNISIFVWKRINPIQFNKLTQLPTTLSLLLNLYSPRQLQVSCNYWNLIKRI